MERLTWPLVGRAQVLSSLEDAVGDGRSIVVKGEPGVGKSRVLHELARRREIQTGEVVWLRAVEATARLPLAPLRALLPERVPLASGNELARQALVHLRGRSRDHELLVCVDDAHLLNAEVAGFVHEVATNRVGVVALTARATERTAPAIGDLWRSGWADRVELPLLTPTEIVDLVQLALGGRLEPQAARAICVLSEGYPLYVRELVIGALERGALSRSAGGIWHLTGELGATPRVTELVADRVRTLGADERAALVVAAAQPPVPLAVMTRIVDEGTIRRLVERGFLDLDEQGRRLDVRPSHALHGEVVRAGHDPADRRRLLGALAEAWADTPTRRRSDRAIVADLLLAAGRMPSTGWLLGAAESPDADPARAATLAGMAVRSGGGWEAQLALAEALARDGRWPDADRTFARAYRTCPPSARAEIAVAWASRARDHELDLAPVAELARRLDEDVGDDPSFALTHLQIRMFLEPLDRTLPALREIYGRRDLPTPSQAMNRLALATVLEHHGDLAESLELTAGHEGDDELPVLDQTRLALVRGTSSAWSGHLGDALLLYERELARIRAAGDADQEMTITRVGQESHVLAGRMQRAAEIGRSALQLLPVCSETRVRSGVVADHVLALSSMRGTEPEVRRWLEDSDGWPATVHYVWRALLALASSSLTRSAGERHRLLERSADLARERSCAIHLALALRERSRRGASAEVAGELTTVAHRTGGVPVLWANIAQASAAGDATRLAQLSAEAEMTGAVLDAAEAAIHAAQLLADVEPARSFLHARRAHRLAAAAPGADLARRPPPSPVTAREAQALEQAISGSTDRQIAESWGVSTRTVHGHLHRAYRKLAVGGREELSALVPDVELAATRPRERGRR